jgi:hypothetical protein
MDVQALSAKTSIPGSNPDGASKFLKKTPLQRHRHSSPRGHYRQPAADARANLIDCIDPSMRFIDDMW